MDFPVFDLHCDTAETLVGVDIAAPVRLRKNNVHIDLERASSLSGYAQCFACFTTTTENPLHAIELFEKKLAAIIGEVEKNNDVIRLAYSADDVEENCQNGIMSSILTIEGPAGFGFDSALLQDLYSVGFRITSLGWNERNPLTGSHVTGGGLTEQGREYVQQAQQLGMLVDVSHISDEGFYDIMDITRGPVVATHSNSRSVHNVSRNLTDDMFLQICKSNGVAGINLYSEFLGENADVDTVCDHIFHFLSLDPDGKHIALGSDFDGCDRLPVGIFGIQDYPVLARRLIERGLTEEMVYNIFWNNALEVFRQCNL